MAAVPDRWAILRVRFAGPFVLVRLRDSDGGQVRLSWEGPFSFPDHIVASIAERVQLLVNTLPLSRFGPYDTGPVPLALFVDVARFLWSHPRRIDSLLTLLTEATDANRVQIVGFSGALRRQRPLFTLPFRIVSHGAQAHAAVLAVTHAHWTYDPDVKERGFAIDTELHADSAGLDRVLRATPASVLVTDAAQAAVEVAYKLPLERRPRLILSIDSNTATSPPGLPPPGTALALFGLSMPVVESFLYGLVHDLPIHEAVKATVRNHPSVAPLARVFADPFTNHSLRIRDALIALQSEVEELEVMLPRASVSEFLTRVEKMATGADATRIHAVRRRVGVPVGRKRVRVTHGVRRIDGARGTIDDAVVRLRGIRRAAEKLTKLPADFENFQKESAGLVPMTKTAAHLSSLARRAADQMTALAKAMRDPGLIAVLEEHQERVVDIALQRIETSPLLSLVTGATMLEAGAVYRLRVHIGNRQPESLVVGPQPPIDPLLPEPEEAGHLLEVVVQGKDFEVVGERTQPLQLPRFGGSGPVYFGVRAPRAAGEASLRVHVYYHNHLIQSYLLEARVGPQEVEGPAPGVLRVSLDYSRLERLAAFERAKPRLLSIGVNQGSGGTHNLVVKGSSGASELNLPPLTYKDDVDEFYADLARASRDPVKPNRGRLYPKVAAGAMAPAEAAAVLREFINRGASLYRSLKKKAIISNPHVAKTIAELQTNRDKPIQVTRLDPQFVFPWTLLYDFDLPAQPASAPVCLGLRMGANGPEPCGHTSDSRQYCVYGFWSVRHYLEELIKHVSPAIGPVTKPPRAGIRLVCNSTLPGVADLEKALRSSIGAPHLVQGPAKETALLDLLWATPPERPAILVVLGHMEARKISRRIDSPAIVLRAGEWLTQENVDSRLQPSPWGPPRPIVLLMACNASTMTATTVNSFVTSFHAAGAAAVLGADAVVASDLAASFARDVSKALWSSQPLGRAMAAFRRRTLAEGNPLAFLFHAIGDVDLTIQ